MLAAITAPVLTSLFGRFVEKIEPSRRQITAPTNGVIRMTERIGKSTVYRPNQITT